MKKLILYASLLFTLISFSFAFAKEDYNFVIFLVDDLGWADVSPNNQNTIYETPNLQKFVNENAVNFSQAYSTNPVCSPSRYGIQTGKYPSRANITNWLGASAKRGEGEFLNSQYNKAGMLDEEITIAEMLKKKGYVTYLGGKWHLGKVGPEKQGYDVTVGINGMGVVKFGKKKYFAPFREPKWADAKKNEYYPDRLAQETINFIKENKNKKFLAFHNFNLVHGPLSCKDEIVQKYIEKMKKMGINPEGEYEEIPIFKGTRTVMKSQSNPTYAAMVEYMDTIVGRILKAIDDSGLKNKTVVIFTSDNGATIHKSSCNKPLREGKSGTFEGGIRIPLMIRIPEIKPSREICDEAYVSTMDLFPTICELAGISIEHKIDGISILPLLNGDRNFKRGDIYWDYPHYDRASGGIRSGDWKLIEYYEDGHVALYNLKNDLGEKIDLSDKYPEQVESMKKKLHAWYKDVDAKFLQFNKDSPNRQPWRPKE